MNEKYCDEVDNRMQEVVKRMGLIAYRMVMVLTVVRYLENVLHKSSSSGETVQLICYKFNYSIAMSICDILFHYAVSAHQSMLGNQSRRFNTATLEIGVYV